MHVAIPFDVETVKQSWGQAARMWGRVMGNHTFVSALARADACSRLTLFVPARRDVELVSRTLLAGLGACAGKVNVVPFARLQAFFDADAVDVVHMLDPNMWFAAHLRSQIARREFPVTGVTHSLGNQHFLEWALLNNANGVRADDCLVCSTPTAQATVQSIFGRLSSCQPGFAVPRTTVIPFGVSVAQFDGSASTARARLAIHDDTFVVASLARFNPQFKMDLRPVLRLASLTRQKATRMVKFVLAGSSGDGDYVRFIRDHIRQEGLEGCVELALDPDEPAKVGLLQAADAFLSLSDNIQETFGLTPIEAMAAGLPVVASDWDGYRSLIEEGVSGFLVPTRMLAPDPSWEALLALRYDALVHLYGAQTTAVDLEVASERLAQLAGDAPLRERMAGAARERARLFEWDRVIGQYMALWQQMTSSRSSDRKIAAALPERSSALRFLEDFTGYATATLDPGDRFRTSPTGKALLKSRALPLLYFETDEFLEMDLMAGILERCIDGRTVAQLTEVLRGKAPGGAVQVSQNILWLYKYGYLRSA